VEKTSSTDWDLPYFTGPTEAAPTPRAPIETAPEPPRLPPAGPPPAGGGAPPPPRPTSRGRAAALLAATALAAGAVGGVVGAKLTDDRPGTGSTATTVGRQVSTGPSSTVAGQALDLQGILAKAGPAVVSIRASGPGGSGAGTGVVITADGEVLTNAHVVRGANTVRVRLEGEAQSREATIVGSDGVNDLALLKIRDASALPTAELGDSASVKVGDDVVAIGNALGLQGEPTVTRGIVSATDRTLDTLTGLIQHDAAINPGNSGGPLLNRSGQVIAINTATAGQGTGIGFAIPVDHAKTVIERLRRGETAPPVGWLGVQTTDPDDGSRGALITAVVSGQPADAAGLRQDDLITAVDGTPVTGAADLGGLVREHQPGQRSTITVTRNGQSRTFEVTFGSKPSN
jgi:S1-C subfamily serine protease